MKVILKESIHADIDEICITYHYINDKMARTISSLIQYHFNDIELIEKDYSKYKIYLKDIEYIESLHHKVMCVHQGKLKTMNIKSIKAIKDKLKVCGFIQISSTIYINQSLIKGYKVIENSKRLIILNNGKEFVVSRKYKDAVDQLFK